MKKEGKTGVYKDFFPGDLKGGWNSLPKRGGGGQSCGEKRGELAWGSPRRVRTGSEKE